MDNYVADYSEREHPQSYNRYYCKQCNERVNEDEEYCDKECDDRYTGGTL